MGQELVMLGTPVCQRGNHELAATEGAAENDEALLGRRQCPVAGPARGFVRSHGHSRHQSRRFLPGRVPSPGLAKVDLNICPRAKGFLSNV